MLRLLSHRVLNLIRTLPDKPGLSDGSSVGMGITVVGSPSFSLVLRWLLAATTSFSSYFFWIQRPNYTFLEPFCIAILLIKQGSKDARHDSCQGVAFHEKTTFRMQSRRNLSPDIASMRRVQWYWDVTDSIFFAEQVGLEWSVSRMIIHHQEERTLNLYICFGSNVWATPWITRWLSSRLMNNGKFTWKDIWYKFGWYAFAVKHKHRQNVVVFCTEGTSNSNIQAHKQTCVCPHGEEVHARKLKLYASTQDTA
jgi:hypothetical protein